MLHNRAAAAGNPRSAWLWLADVGPATRPDWVERHTAWLSASELARLERIVRPERRAQLLAGHILLRHLVAARTGAAPGAVQVGTLADGRPEVRAPAGWRASLTHSKQWAAALVVAGECVAGVDIEWMDPRRDIEALVRTACEMEAGSRELAYRLWTQREAEIKAGPGLNATHVATWDDRALAVCAETPPAAAGLLDLDSDRPPRPLDLDWTTRPRLSALVPAASRAHG